jgi:hypothetical protein
VQDGRVPSPRDASSGYVFQREDVVMLVDPDKQPRQERSSCRAFGLTAAETGLGGYRLDSYASCRRRR